MKSRTRYRVRMDLARKYKKIVGYKISCKNDLREKMKKRR